MKQSESIAQLAVALVTAQANMQVAIKDATNPAFRTKYADLGAVWDACRAALQDNALSVLQAPVACESGFAALETMLLHASGEFVSSTAQCRLVKDDPQGYGSAITYLRRYALSAMLGIVADDDDGNAASGQTVRAAPSTTPTEGKKLNATQQASLTKRLNDAFAGTPHEDTNHLQFATRTLKRNVKSFAEVTVDEAAILTETAKQLATPTARESETEGDRRAQA
ncbi:ERF family protein [Deinococcus peraridilitoris]|uniref:ERF superfamily protein n=1 Tax=Deinococcus peraridilitoris (strain DSM 19664 / LMG 22246 / CIP 109416 / KR-200) TaxID=937777 RepID=L0A109_DEIPD|nr:ERF family protein [Deinococcus peraridilitoris]AFZ67119.1 ERF superfamily protein [Deinococcus peraridilitoris DSM 19664]